ncbi:hypothetical protein JB92DRAFT_3137451 [Gautieria morchelliformis]|nr:hypothetical protein JB92DRAFT_3137451 [Gautieria morchelliformis]
MLVPDLMHELELGVWKALLTHLIRILASIGPHVLVEFNRRFWDIPGFGHSTIRWFGNNVPDMKKLAAHDYEDILQCVIPIIEGLVPEPFGGIILDVLWEVCQWHGLAKLRLHTETTLARLDGATTTLGKQFHRFIGEVCYHMETFETPSEVQARQRRQARALGLQLQGAPKGRGTDMNNGGPAQRKRKTLNLQTYKFHALGHYVQNIRLFRTTDSYTTQIGELAHRHAKSHYWLRTNKRGFLGQLAKHDSRAHQIQAIREHVSWRGIKTAEHHVPLASEPLPYMSPAEHYHISQATRHPLYVGPWVGQHDGDPALVSFVEKLKDHLLSRMQGAVRAGEEAIFSSDERNHLFFQHDRIYRHAMLRVNYTTYDVHREQDFINPQTAKRDVMLTSNEDPTPGGTPHPYWYARVLGIFHAQVQRLGASGLSPPVSFDFLWVCWFGRDPEYRSGWSARRLDRVGFVPESDEDTFGFLDSDCPFLDLELVWELAQLPYKLRAFQVRPCLQPEHPPQKTSKPTRWQTQSRSAPHPCQPPTTPQSPSNLPGLFVAWAQDASSPGPRTLSIDLSSPSHSPSPPRSCSPHTPGSHETSPGQTDEDQRALPGTKRNRLEEQGAEGLKYDTNEAPLEHYSEDAQVYIQLFIALEHVPGIIEAVREQGVDEVADFLDDKHNDAWGEDVKCVKDNAQYLRPLSRAFAPPLGLTDKITRGFRHPQLSRLIFPWAGWKSLTPQLADGKRMPYAHDWPLFLFDEERFDMDDLFKSFLRNDILIHCTRWPSRKVTRRGNARINHMTRVTVPALAYISTLVYFALGSQETFGPGGDTHTFNFFGFYRGLITCVNEDLPPADREAMLLWWNRQVFPNHADTDEEGGWPPAKTGHGLMQAQARSRQ